MTEDRVESRRPLDWVRRPVRVEVRRLRQRSIDGWHELPTRLRRARLRGLPGSARALVVTAWAWSLVVTLVLALLPASFDQSSPVAGVVWTVSIVSIALIAAASSLFASLGRPGFRTVVTPIVVCLLPVSVITGQRTDALSPPVWILAVVALVAGVLVALRVRQAVVVLVVASGGTWIVLLLQPLLTPPPFGAVPLKLFGFAMLSVLSVVVLDYLAVSGIAGVVRKRHAAAATRFQRDVALRWAVVAVIVALIVMVLRFTVLAGIFGATDALLWAAKAWTSWPHAVLVGGLIVLLVLRTERTPLSRGHQRAMLLGVTTAALATAAQLLVATGVIYLDTLAGRATVLAPSIALVQPIVTLLGLGVVAVAAVRSPRGSAARPAALLTLLYILPALRFLLGFGAGGIPPVWSTTPEVALVVVVGAGICAVVRGVRRTGPPPRVIARLAIVPLIVLHAFSLVPAVISGPFGPWLAVVLLAVAILLSQPPAQADPRLRLRRAAGAAALQLAAPTALLMNTGAALPADDAISALGLLWLGVPLTFLFACRLIPESREPSAASRRARRLRRLLQARATAAAPAG